MKLTRLTTLSPAPMGFVALVNVVLLLLFFFLLGSSFVLQPGIAVTLPFSRFNLPPQVDGPPARVFYRDRQVSVDELDRELAAFGGSPRAVILRADRGTPCELVVAVIDRALKQGYSVALATAPPPDATP